MRTLSIAAVALCATAVSPAAQSSRSPVNEFDAPVYLKLRQWFDENISHRPSKRDDITLALNFFSFSQIEPKKCCSLPNNDESGWFKISECKYKRVKYTPSFTADPLDMIGVIAVIDLNKVNWKSSVSEMGQSGIAISLRSESNNFVSETQFKYQNRGDLPQQSVNDRNRIDFYVESTFDRVISAVKLIASECKGASTPF